MNIPQLDSTYIANTYARFPVTIARGKGSLVWDADDKVYIDMATGIAVNSFGIADPAWIRAVTEQLCTVQHASNLYYTAPDAQLAQLLCEKTGMKKVFFSNSGAEANECAIKLARLYARRRTEAAGKDAELAPRLIVTLAKSFHGRTLATLAATAQPAKQEAFQPLPAGFTATPINDVEALERLFETQGDRICAVMIECIQGESGVHPCTEEFIGAIRRLTEEHGALMICDEVQSGIFRTGLPYGFQNFGVLPDIVTMAKGIASGVVAGACAAKSSIAAAFAPGDHGTTFGGSNIAMAAAHVTLSTLLAPGMGAQIESVGAYMRERLARLPHVQEVRGFGLMKGIDLTHEAPSAPDVVAAGLEAGLVLNATGPHTLRFLPPLICTEADVDVLVQKLEQLL